MNVLVKLTDTIERIRAKIFDFAPIKFLAGFIENSLSVLSIIFFLAATSFSGFFMQNSAKWYFSLQDKSNWEETIGVVDSIQIEQSTDYDAALNDQPEEKTEVKITLLNHITGIFGVESSELDYTIYDSDTANTESIPMTYRPVIEYSYEVDGIEYSNSVIAAATKVYYTYNDAVAFLQGIELVGEDQIKIYYLKDRPKTSVLILDSELSNSTVFFVSTIIFLLLAVISTLFILNTVLKK